MCAIGRYIISKVGDDEWYRPALKKIRLGHQAAGQEHGHGGHRPQQGGDLTNARCLHQAGKGHVYPRRAGRTPPNCEGLEFAVLCNMHFFLRSARGHAMCGTWRVSATVSAGASDRRQAWCHSANCQLLHLITLALPPSFVAYRSDKAGFQLLCVFCSLVRSRHLSTRSGRSPCGRCCVISASVGRAIAQQRRSDVACSIVPESLEFGRLFWHSIRSAGCGCARQCAISFEPCRNFEPCLNHTTSVPARSARGRAATASSTWAKSATPASSPTHWRDRYPPRGGRRALCFFVRWSHSVAPATPGHALCVCRVRRPPQTGPRIRPYCALTIATGIKFAV